MKTIGIHLILVCCLFGGSLAFSDDRQDGESGGHAGKNEAQAQVDAEQKAKEDRANQLASATTQAEQEAALQAMLESGDITPEQRNSIQTAMLAENPKEALAKLGLGKGLTDSLQASIKNIKSAEPLAKSDPASASQSKDGTKDGGGTKPADPTPTVTDRGDVYNSPTKPSQGTEIADISKPLEGHIRGAGELPTLGQSTTGGKIPNLSVPSSSPSGGAGVSGTPTTGGGSSNFNGGANRSISSLSPSDTFFGGGSNSAANTSNGFFQNPVTETGGGTSLPAISNQPVTPLQSSRGNSDSSSSPNQSGGNSVGSGSAGLSVEGASPALAASMVILSANSNSNQVASVATVSASPTFSQNSPSAILSAALTYSPPTASVGSPGNPIPSFFDAPTNVAQVPSRTSTSSTEPMAEAVKPVLSESKLAEIKPESKKEVPAVSPASTKGRDLLGFIETSKGNSSEINVAVATVTAVPTVKLGENISQPSLALEPISTGKAMDLLKAEAGKEKETGPASFLSSESPKLMGIAPELENKQLETGKPLAKKQGVSVSKSSKAKKAYQPKKVASR